MDQVIANAPDYTAPVKQQAERNIQGLGFERGTLACSRCAHLQGLDA